MARVPSRILGPDGQPLLRDVLTEEIAGPTVTGVRHVLSEHPSNGLTPGRLGTILRQAEAGDTAAYLALAEDLEEKFLHYRAVLSTRRLAVSGLPITVEAASDEAIDIEAADLVRTVVSDQALPDVLYDLLDGIGKGYAVAEIIWEMSARQWMPSRIEWRDPRWFQLDRADLTTLRLRDEGHPDGRALDPFKFIIHRPKTKSGLPIRGGLARPACWAWLFTSYGTKDWLSFIETYGQPIRVGRYGPGATTEERAALLRAVRNIASDAAAIIPQSMMLEFVRAEGASANADMFKALVEFFERQVSKLVLGQTTTTDAISGGHAVAQEHRQVQGDIEAADARQLSVTLQRDLVEPLVRLNLGDRPAYPTVRIGRPETEDLNMTLKALGVLVPMGLRVEASVIRDKFGLPDPEDGAELLGQPLAPATPQPPPTLTEPAQLALAAAQPAQVPAQEPDAVDEMVEHLLGDWQELTGDLVDQVLAAAAAATDADDFTARLAVIAAGADLTALQEALAKGQFMARVGARTGFIPQAE